MCQKELMFQTKKKGDKLSALHIRNDSLGKLEASNFESIDTVSSFFGGITNRIFGDDKTVPFADASTTTREFSRPT